MARVSFDAESFGEDAPTSTSDFASPSQRNMDPRRSLSIMQPPTAASGSVVDNIKVIARVRPFNNREYEIQDEMNSKLPEWERRPLRSVVYMTDKVTQFLDYNHDYAVKEEFKFDYNFWSIPPDQQENPDVEFATQLTVFKNVGKLTLDHSFNGFNNCIFAYGQTGSGKTHTMMGIPSDKGLIPRFCETLFEMIQEKEDVNKNFMHKDIQSVNYTVEARFLEIYNEHVKDLLFALSDPATRDQYDKDNLKIRHNPEQGPYVVGLTFVEVKSWEECNAIIEAGMSNRSVAATKMNDTSSRSHAIFKLTLRQFTTLKPQKQFDKPKVLERFAAINLVDLAGSERLKKSGAEGQRLKEAAAINLSLTTLKNVIDALVENRPLIPYRDSTLTWLLSDSLGGNSRTFMIACLSPHLDNAEETFNTLRYALRTQGVVNVARVNENEEARKITALQRELAEAQRLLTEGADGEKNLLKREMEEKFNMLNELEEKRHIRKALEGELMHGIEEERRRTFNAIYANAFRSKLLQRISEKLLKNKDVLIKQMAETEIEIKETKQRVVEMENECKASKNQEDDMNIAFKKAERELKKIQTQFQVISEQIRKMGLDLDRVSEDLRKAKLRRNATRFICGGIQAILSKKLMAVYDELVGKQAQELQAISRKGQADKNSICVNCQTTINELKREMEIIKEEMTSVSQQIQLSNDDRKAQIRRLTEDITFFERENRNLDDERVERVTELEKQHSVKYQNETSRLSERSVKGRQIIEQRHGAFLHEIGRQMKMAKTEHENNCKNVSEQWGNRLQKVIEESESALADLANHYTEVIKEHDSQIEDAKVFLHDWAHSMRNYNNVKREIMSMAMQFKDSRDSELRELIEMTQSMHPNLSINHSSPSKKQGSSPNQIQPSISPAPSKSSNVVSLNKGCRLGSRRTETSPKNCN